MSTQQTTLKPRKRIPRPELSIFEEELNVPFNKDEFLPDLPPHARDLTALSPSIVTEEASETTDNKAATNREQTDNKAATNREQTDNKAATNREQIKSPATNFSLDKSETGNKVATKLATLSATKWQQTDNKPTTTAPFSGLVGLQRAILIVIYNACKAARDRVSDALTLEHLAKCLKTSTGSVKTTLQRLETKGYILRIAFKNGRGGWSRYELPEVIFRDLLQLETENKLATNWQQTDNKVGTQPATQPATSLSSSSSFIDIEDFKTTTTSESELFDNTKVQMSPEWAAVDFSSLSEIGFSREHLIQLVKHGKLSAAEVQDSIHFFAFDLKRNGKGREIKGPPLNFFMGIIRKGLPYAPPENFESPEAEACRKYLEGKRRLKEDRKKQERELLNLEFEEWRRVLTQNEVNAIVPEVVRNIVPARESSLKSYFEERVWRERSLTIPGTVNSEGEIVRQKVTSSLEDASGEFTV